MGNRRKVEMAPHQLAAMETRIVARLKSGVSVDAVAQSSGLSRGKVKEIAARHDIDVGDRSRRRATAWA